MSALSYREPIVKPARAKHTATVIFLHGLGDSGDGWSDMARQFADELGYCKFIFPNAPSQPVTLNTGMRMPAWFDIRTLDDVGAAEDENGLNESVRYVQSLIQKEVDAGIPSSRIVVSGFSQGGAVSLLQLRAPVALAGIAGLSCWLPLSSKPGIVSPANAKTPVAMWHGTADPVVQYRFGQLTQQRLKQEGVQVSFSAIQGMPHTALPEELAQWLAFVQKVLPPT